MLACFVFKSNAKVRQKIGPYKFCGVFFGKKSSFPPKSGNFAGQNPYLYMRITTIFVALFLSLVPSTSWAQRLFHIARSLNKNIVCYDVNTVNGKLDTKNPIHVYWHNNEDKPGVEEELSALQRRLAYGYKVRSTGQNEAHVSLTAYNKRQMRICQQGKTWIAVIKINGQDGRLKELYVKTKGPMSVEYVELRGTPLTGGKQISERIKP